MKSKILTMAFIDGANLYRGIQSLGWELDYKRFRVWLHDKYGVTTAFIFIGLVPKYKALYTQLQQAGFVLVFKETTVDSDGVPKGNCDTELVLKAVSGYYEREYNTAVVVSSDGDYACLAQFLRDKKAFRSLLSPHKQCSFLLRKLNVPIVYLNTQRSILAQKEKAPDRDETL